MAAGVSHSQGIPELTISVQHVQRQVSFEIHSDLYVLISTLCDLLFNTIKKYL